MRLKAGLARKITPASSAKQTPTSISWKTAASKSRSSCDPIEEIIMPPDLIELMGGILAERMVQAEETSAEPGSITWIVITLGARPVGVGHAHGPGVLVSID